MKAEPLALQALTSLKRKRGKLEVGIGTSKGLVSSGWWGGMLEGEASSRESRKRKTGHQKL